MYENIHLLPIDRQVEVLTKHLVSINSINGTTGEVEIIEELYNIAASFPYFRENKEHVWLQDVPSDPVGRKNLFAFVEGKAKSPVTIIYHSHLDTVGIEDFGLLKNQAFSPDELAEYFKTYQANQDVQNDAKSGDWLFGRGSVDMKSGAAVHLANILHFSQNPEELQGNVLLIFNGDEEGEHRGITASLQELKRLQYEKNLEYVLAINTDFITPLYDGDHHRYIYTGAAGKLLPCFYIYGREVHVGDTLAGIDPNFIAAKITERLHNNYKLTEFIPGELVLPPTCLYQRDNKESYTVQTATSSQLYFNYFVYESTPNQVIEQLVEETKQACQEAEQYLREQFQNYLLVTDLPPRDLSWEVEVLTYGEYVEELHRKGIDTEKALEDVLNRNEKMDLRELSFKMVDALQQLDPDKKARVIIFFAAPFLPHNYLSDNTRDQELRASIVKVLKEVQEQTGEQFALKKFFPYLADGSFLSIHETKEELEPLLKNFPKWDQLYPLPYETIRNLDIPSINMGVFGKDGHKWTERVYKPYSFKTLPLLIQKTTVEVLSGGARYSRVVG
ncbi:M20/M25/M40 family metallo-hydrolase [Bacillus sp. FJAT-47783]|uniref:M20/M25/M40 family metallo-hydrolase n=1 Tax=Bacillus sp. FJAT-47783 TaxID=2922712 RepID=UPI001FAB6CA9|nr:M20/M25/M40 family metallo-hydrolase [Bacillus sp. FJAT-47783]